MLLKVSNLRTYFYTYKGVVKAVDGISFGLERGRALGIAGESGCGKSTTAYSIIRLVPPPGRIVGGQILLDGTDILKMSDSQVRRQIRWNRVAMIFQSAMSALTPVYSIGYQIAEPLVQRGMTKSNAMERAGELLELVGLEPAMLRRYPHELSGGQKQRVFIAMALTLNPDILIADEPTTALDVVVQAQILNLLKKLKRELNMALILITHDLGVIAELVDEIAIMYAGKIVEMAPSEKIFLQPAHVYTRGLLKSVPKLRHPEQIKYIAGLPPDLVNPPAGCRFHPRCEQAMDICKRREPPISRIADSHYVCCWLFEVKDR